MGIFSYYNAHHIMFRRDQTNKQGQKSIQKCTLLLIPVHINLQPEFILVTVHICISTAIFILIFKWVACLHVP